MVGLGVIGNDKTSPVKLIQAYLDELLDAFSINAQIAQLIVGEDAAHSMVDEGFGRSLEEATCNGHADGMLYWGFQEDIEDLLQRIADHFAAEGLSLPESPEGTHVLARCYSVLKACRTARNPGPILSTRSYEEAEELLRVASYSMARIALGAAVNKVLGTSSAASVLIPKIQAIVFEAHFLVQHRLALKHILFSFLDEVVHVVCEASGRDLKKALLRPREELRTQGSAGSYEALRATQPFGFHPHVDDELAEVQWASLLDHIDDELSKAFVAELMSIFTDTADENDETWLQSLVSCSLWTVGKISDASGLGLRLGSLLRGLEVDVGGSMQVLDAFFRVPSDERGCPDLALFVNFYLTQLEDMVLSPGRDGLVQQLLSILGGKSQEAS